MSIDVSSGAAGETSVPRMLFQVPWAQHAALVAYGAGHFHLDETVEEYALAGDANRFLIAEPVERTSLPITVVLNWTAGLKQ